MLAIIRDSVPPDDPVTLALQALVFVLSDGARSSRLLALTGLDADALRAGAVQGDRAVLGAVMEFLANHEADLVAAADALDIRPERLAAVWENLR